MITIEIRKIENMAPDWAKTVRNKGITTLDRQKRAEKEQNLAKRKTEWANRPSFEEILSQNDDSAGISEKQAIFSLGFGFGMVMLGIFSYVFGFGLDFGSIFSLIFGFGWLFFVIGLVSLLDMYYDKTMDTDYVLPPVPPAPPARQRRDDLVSI